MKNKIVLLGLLVAGGLVAGAEYLGLTWMYNLVVIEFGVLALIAGIQIMITGKAKGGVAGMSQAYGDSKYRERHTGMQARMIGIVVLLGGTIFIAMSVIDLAIGMDAFWREFLDSPRAWGLVAAVAGLMLTLIGLVRAKSGSGAEKGAYSDMVEAEFKGGGIVTTLAGLALLVLGAIMMIYPSLLQGTLDELFQ